MMTEPQAQHVVAENILDYAEKEPSGGVFQRYDPHEVVGVMGIVPWAGVERAQQHPERELPNIEAQNIDREADETGSPETPMNPHMHLLDEKAAAGSDEERRERRMSPEVKSPVLKQIEDTSEDDFVAESLNTVHVNAKESRHG